jgi:hypothetical protein
VVNIQSTHALLVSCTLQGVSVEPSEALTGPAEFETLEKGGGGCFRFRCLRVDGRRNTHAHLALPGAGAADVKAAILRSWL